VRNTVPIHDLGATKLQVRSVDLATEQLVDSLGTGKDDGLTLNLDGTLSKTDKISTNTWAKLVLYMWKVELKYIPTERQVTKVMVKMSS
jgi:hypothetical protein